MSHPEDRAKQQDKKKKQAMLQWLNRNQKHILTKYKNQYIAYHAKGMLAHSENLQEVLSLANSFQEDYLIYLVPRKTASIQILPIHFRSKVRHDHETFQPGIK